MKPYPIPNYNEIIKENPYVHSKEIVNLKTCELLHPELEKILNTSNIKAEHIQSYPNFNDIKDKLSNFYKVSSGSIILSAGSEPIISIIVEALGKVTNRIILQTPNYISWYNYPILRNISIIEVPLNKTLVYQFCLEDFIKAIQVTPPSLVVISNPNNPTGFLFSIEDIKILSKECVKYGHLLVIDECFANFSNIDHYKEIGLNENIIFIKSFSKSFGIAGARIAVTFASKRLSNYIAAWKPQGPVSGPAIQILKNVLDKAHDINRICLDIIDSREKFIASVRTICPNWIALPSGANYVTFIVSPGESPKEITKKLFEHGYKIADLSSFKGLELGIRVGIAHWDIMSNLLKVIVRIYSNRLKLQ